jgi:hypothetical protein
LAIREVTIQPLSRNALGGRTIFMRISNSFSEGEIQVMDFIVQTLLRGGSPTMATRNKDFASLCRKILAMKAKVNEKQITDELGAQQPAKPEDGASLQAAV